MDSKKWYQSKIVLLFVALFSAAIYQFHVADSLTQEQLDAVAGLTGAAQQAYENAKSGQNVLSWLLSLAAPVGVFFRVWLTNKKIL